MLQRENCLLLGQPFTDFHNPWLLDLLLKFELQRAVKCLVHCVLKRKQNLRGANCITGRYKQNKTKPQKPNQNNNNKKTTKQTKTTNKQQTQNQPKQT